MTEFLGDTIYKNKILKTCKNEKLRLDFSLSPYNVHIQSICKNTAPKVLSAQ